MSRPRRLLGALGAGSLLATGVLAMGAVSAGAAGPPPPLLIVRRVDATAFPTVHIDVSTNGADVAPSAISLNENGKAATGLQTQTLSRARTPIGTVLLIDTASTMRDGNKFGLVKTMLKALIQGKGDAEQMAIVPFGGGPRVAQAFTPDSGLLNATIDRLALGGFPSLHAGVQMAGGLLATRPELLGNIVVVGDGAGGPNAVEPAATIAGAYGQLAASRAMLYAVGLKFGPGLDLAPLSKLAATAHGSYVEAADAAGVGRVTTAIENDLSRQFELTYKSSAKAPADLVISASGGSTDAQMFPGSVAVGEATHPAIVNVVKAPGILGGKVGLFLIALVVLAAAGLFVYAVSMLITRDSNNLRSALRPYQEGRKSQDDDDHEGSLISSALMQRAVDTTERLANEQGLLTKVEAKLVQADIKLRAAEAILFYVFAVLIVTILAVLLKGPLGLAVGLFAALIPPAILNFMAKMRLRKFNSQLPDTLQLLSSSLRAGFSFMQGVEAVAAEVDDPMGSELRRVIVESRLGRPVEDALDDCVERMKSPDFEWAVMAVKIQREVGGNLAELLQTVAVTMVERERLRRDVKTLTAEGRMSAYVLGAMPPILGVFFEFSNPSYMHPLWANTSGVVAVIAASIAMVVGFIWMNKIIQIDV